MVDAAKTAKTSVYVGSDDYLVALAVDGGDERYIRSMSLAGAAAIDRIPTLGSEGIEAIVNQESMTISAAILYGGSATLGPKALRAKQDNTDNLMVIIGTDALCHYVLPITWTGQPISNPTASLITTDMEFLLSAIGVDGGPVAGKTRAKQFPAAPNTFTGGTEKTGFASATAGDVIYVVVTEWAGPSAPFTLENGGGDTLSTSVNIDSVGIYKVVEAAGQTFGDAMSIKLGGTGASKLTDGWFLAGVPMTIDGG